MDLKNELPIPALPEIGGLITIVGTTRGGTVLPMETLSLNFSKIEINAADADLTGILIGLNQPDSADGTPGSQAILISGLTPTGAITLQGAILIIPILDDEGSLKDVIVHFWENPDASSTSGPDTRPIIIGRLPNPDMNGLAVIVGPLPDDGNAQAEETWLHSSYIWFSW
jgi:hypothetical protein